MTKFEGSILEKLKEIGIKPRLTEAGRYLLCEGLFEICSTERNSRAGRVFTDKKRLQLQKARENRKPKKDKKV
jgi:hypothetical protein